LVLAVLALQAALHPYLVQYLQLVVAVVVIIHQQLKMETVADRVVAVQLTHHQAPLELVEQAMQVLILQ
jgi:hypothetical protein